MSAIKASHRAARLAASALLAFGIACSPAFADNRHRQNEDRRPRAEEGARMSLDEAVRRAERAYNARVVKAESRNIDGRVMYILRLVSDDGRVFTVQVDAQSGNMN
jgi:uncharacterized membrane protein YkoI